MQAQLFVGTCLLLGEGAARDPKEAVRYFRTAPKRGLALAQYNLACCHLNGQDTRRQAVVWF